MLLAIHTIKWHEICGVTLLALLLLVAFPTASLAQSMGELQQQCERLRSLSDYDALRAKGRQLADKARTSGNRRAEGYGLMYEGVASLFVGDGSEALTLLHDAWEIARSIGNDSIGASVENARGIYYAMYQNNSFQAQRYFFRSLDLATKANYESMKIRVYGNLLVLSGSSNDLSGFQYAQKIYQYGLKHNDYEQTFMGVYYMASYYRSKGDLRRAREFIGKAVELYKRYPYSDIASVYILYSQVEQDAGNLEESRRLAKEGVSLAKKYNQMGLLPDAYLQMAIVYNKAARYEESNRSAQQVIDISSKVSLSNKVIDSHKLMARNFMALGNKDEAVAHLLSANEGMDTLARANMDRLMRERSILDSIQNKERQVELHRVKMEGQRKLNTLLMVIVGVLVALLAVIIYYVRARNKLIKRIVAQSVWAVGRQNSYMVRVAELEKKLKEKEAATAPVESAVPKDSEAETPDMKSSGLLTDDGARMQELYDRICNLMEEKRLYAEPQLNRERVAALLNTNRTYLSKVIKEKSGMTYLQFVNSYRINEAVRILSDPDKLDFPLKQIWSDLGFSSPTTFYKQFQDAVGITPSVYRRQVLEIESEQEAEEDSADS